MDDTPTHGADDTLSRMDDKGLEASAPIRRAQEIAEAPELRSLRGDPAFEAQVARARKNAAKPQ